MKNSGMRFWGWAAMAAGVFLAWKPVRMLFSVPFPFARFILRTNSAMLFRLIGGALLVLAGIVIVVINREKKPFWQSKMPFMKGAAKKKVMKLTDVSELTRILNAPQASEDIKKAAGERRKTVLKEMLDSGSDEDIRREVGNVVSSGLYDPDRTEFLAEAAQKRPAIIKEFWPRLQSWAHSDSKSHTDKPGGFHTDRTEYYDYFRYPDGRTVANKNGRKRHTDTRGSYSDCHDDRHQDSSTHIDNPHEAKIARFKPFIPEEADGKAAEASETES
ncbi:MAG: hypothetical protein IJM51_05270 [Clostridia bacterium]|nr:hypothetical protein [Clostridia bacterium]